MTAKKQIDNAGIGIKNTTFHLQKTSLFFVREGERIIDNRINSLGAKNKSRSKFIG
jgi:hypothetical protein